MFGFNKNVCQDVKKNKMIRTKFLITLDASSNLPIANTGKGSVSMRNGVHFYIKTIPDKMYTCTCMP